jgi:uncharacterized protein YjbJ (UPF0337 family)
VLFVKSSQVDQRARKEVEMNADQFRGRFAEVMGRVEEFAGRILGSRPLIERGRVILAVGLARARFGDVKEAVRRRGLMSVRGRRSTT